jgi:hypothetical protein
MFPFKVWEDCDGFSSAAVPKVSSRRSGLSAWHRLDYCVRQQTLTKEQIKQFLLTAKVVKSKQSNKGMTQPWRLTLRDGTVTHDALSKV